MSRKYTEAQAAARLDIPQVTFRSLRNQFQNDPTWPWPPKVGRDMSYDDEDLRALDVRYQQYQNEPADKYRCAQCARWTANNRKLHMLGDCVVHGRQVPIVRTTEKRGARRKRKRPPVAEAS